MEDSNNEEVLAENAYYTPREISELAGCRIQMVYNYMKSGRLPYERSEATKHQYRIPRMQGEVWLEGYLKRKAERRAARRY